MVGHLDIHAPGPFKVIGENTNFSKSWEQYVKRFEYYLKATGINKDAQKKALLLHVSNLITYIPSYVAIVMFVHDTGHAI